MVFTVLALLGIGGILGMTVFFPLLASASSKLFKKKSTEPSITTRRISTVTIAIPAHNEENLLPQTLQSIWSAIRYASKIYDCRFEIIVAADGCNDRTEAIAAESGVTVVQFKVRQGKWAAISQIAKYHTGGEWIILADCGIEWDQKLLAELLPLFSDKNLIGVAPGYRNRNASPLESVAWRIETQSKYMESKCGGPVSVHGATVCYRREELLAALSTLSRKEGWLNDDVVIPLTLRALYPSKQIRYLLRPEVCDIFINQTKKKASERKRRKRIVIGNLEWIQHLWIPLWKQNYVAAILACRRIFRLLWAYWLSFFAVAIGLSLGIENLSANTAFALVLTLASCIMLIPSLKNLFDCAYASFMSPIYFISMILKSKEASRELSWS